MEFLAPDNVAGQALLQLTARGSAIICELLRLSHHVPSVFLSAGDAGADSEAAKYSSILLDFRYFKSASAYEARIDADGEAGALEEEFMANHEEILRRFYSLFESIWRYVDNLQSYLADMEAGAFLQHTVEGVLQDSDGRQLLCEAFYLYGCMLLLLDLRIPGPARERMIVAHYRYRGEAALPNVKAVQRLCADTGFSPASGKRPANYPEDLFGRIALPADVVDMVLGKLRTEDVYNHSSAYPLPAQRSTALATQGALLYVCLYFAPQTLHAGTAACREIVDRFFPDNWVVSMHTGFVVDLTEAWEPYKAARAALKGALTPEAIEAALATHATATPALNAELDGLLTQGVLTEEAVTESQRKLMHTLRQCNITLRWLVLHRASGNAKVREAVRARVPTQSVLRLLMHTAQYEWRLKSLLRGMLDSKQTRFESLRAQAAELCVELSEVYGGVKALSRVKKSDKLRAWFARIAGEIAAVHYGNSLVAGRTLQQLVHALDEVGDFHQVEASLQVKQCIGEVKQLLTGMLRLANITEKLMADIDVVSDMSYAQKLVAAYTPLIHEMIARDPSTCLLLRATFLKLSSVLSVPLVRIIQAGSSDDVSVAEYYSSELVAYVRGVLEVVPRSVFRILDGITRIHTDRLKPLPPKLERKYVKDAAQLPARYALAKLTHNVSVFTRGILNMHTTLLGIIKLDPQQTLEEGVRKQLVAQMAAAMHEHLAFPQGTTEDFERRIAALGRKLEGLKTSLSYIQDYINVYGLKMWQEEVSRVVLFNVEQETNTFLKTKVYEWQSQYQSEAIPVPVFPRADAKDKSATFMGRVVAELVRQTAPNAAVYAASKQAWLRPSDNKEVVSLRTFALLRQGLGVVGLAGVDKLLSFMIVRDLAAFVRVFRKVVANKAVSSFVFRLHDELTPTSQFPAAGTKLYGLALQKTEKIWAPMSELLVRVGQYQLLRRHVTNELCFTAKTDSTTLHAATAALNTGVLADLRAHYDASTTRPYPANPLMPLLTRYVDAMGLTDPLSKIFLTTEALPGAAVMVFLFVLAHLPRFKWSPELSTLVAATDKDRKQGSPAGLDGAPFVAGVATLLKQLHTAHTHALLAMLGQFVRAHISAAQTGPAAVLPPEVVRVLLFLEALCAQSGMGRGAVDAVVPSYIADNFARV